MSFILEAYLALENVMFRARAKGHPDEDRIMNIMDGVWAMLSEEDKAKLNERHMKEKGE